MGFSRLDRHTKKIIIVISVVVLVYLYLSFGPLGMSLTRLPFEFINAILLAMFFRFKEIPPNVLALVTDTALCIGGFAFWVFFFGQFVLPTHTIKERLSVPPRLFNMLGTEKGPAIFIKEGKVIERGDEGTRNGPGMILLDTASAALLHRRGKEPRAVGPGLVFTEKNELIANTVDLRTQVRILGPKPNDVIFYDEEQGDPLADDPDARLVRDARRLQTSGLTRDGIEVVPNIVTVFRLDATSGDGGSLFGFIESSVKKAVIHEAIVPGQGDGERQTIPWDWLPAHLAADLWREYLRKFTLNQLFDILPREPDAFPSGDTSEFDRTDFDRIVEAVNKRLKQEKVPVLNEVGELVEGEDQISREHKLLEEHGIKVLSVKIDNLRMKDEKKLIDRWRATWLQQALIQQANTEKRGQIRAEKAETEAIMEFANTIANPVYRDLSSGMKDRPDAINTLYELLRSTRSSIVRDPNLIPQLNDELDSIDLIMEWLKNYQNGLEENPGI